MRRFPNSLYATAFRQQFAIQIAANADAGQPERLARVEATLAGLAATERRQVYLVIAKSALDKGKVGMAQLRCGEGERACRGRERGLQPLPVLLARNPDRHRQTR